MGPWRAGARGGRVFREALDALPTASLVASRALTLLHVNPAAEELLGSSAARLFLRPMRALPRVGPALAQLCAGARDAGARVAAEVDLGPPRGKVLARAAPLVRPSGVHGVVLELRPREERVDLESLAAGLAHEIKNPLAALKGAAQLMEQELPQGSPHVEYTRLIAREAARVDGLVRALLDLTRPLPIKPVRQNLHAVCDDVLLLARPLLAPGVTLERRYDPSLPDVEIDRESLTQVLLNLVKNAIEACAAEGGQVTVETGIAPGLKVRRGLKARPLARISVVDEGPGLPEAVELFTPFATTKPKGTGLGLVVSRRIVEAHGGRLELKDRRDRTGVEAEVLLPL